MHISASSLASDHLEAVVFGVSIAALVILATRPPRFPAGEALLVGIAVSLLVNDSPGDVASAGALSYAVLWAYERVREPARDRAPRDTVVVDAPGHALQREAALSAGVAAAFAAVLVWAGPPGTDLAAHVYQRTVFLDHGFTLWNNFWYAGRYSFVTYSLLYYPLAAALGIRLLAVATVATATLAFAVLVLREWGPRARWSSRTFAVVWAGIVLSAAFPFALGAALALLALWALQARHPWRFAGLAALTAAASPVALLLLVLVVVALALGRCGDRWLQIAAGTGLGVILLLEALLWRVFPGGGRYPFSGAELAAACAYCILSTIFAWRVERLRALRWIFPVYGLACLAFFFVHSGVGENIARLRYAAIPVSVLVLSMRDWRPRLPALVVFALAISWNVTPLAASYVHNENHADAHAAYWQPAICTCTRT